MSDHHHYHAYEYQNHYQIVSDQHYCTFDYYNHIYLYQYMPDHNDHTSQIIMIILLIIISLFMTTLCDHDDEFDDNDQR